MSELEPMQFQPQVVLVRDQVTDFIRREILDLRLRPGRRLVERELVDWTGVSRATIRESIRQLAAEGLVDIVPLKGAVVARPSVEEIASIDEVRAVLEGYATGLFTMRASREQVEALCHSVDEMERLIVGKADRWLTFQEKLNYYEILFEGAGNSVLRSTIKSLLHRSVAARVGYSGMHWPMAVIEELREIVKAIVARDPEAAERAATAHVHLRGAEAARFLGRQDLGPDENKPSEVVPAFGRAARTEP